jgi:hypothetical protein
VDLLDSLNILLKRWLLTLPLFILTIGALAGATVVLPWEYESQASMVLLASPLQAKSAGGNPWLVFDGSLTVTAEVVGREMMDDATVTRLRASGLTAAYTVMIAPNSTGPVLSVDVTGKDEANTAATMKAVLAMIPDRLQQIQADGGVAPAARISLSMVSVSPRPQTKSTGKLRNLAVILFAGLSITVVTPLFVESISVRRRTRLRGTTAAPEPGRPADPARLPVIETRIGHSPGTGPASPGRSGQTPQPPYARVPDRSGAGEAGDGT